MRRADALIYARTAQHRRAVERAVANVSAALETQPPWFVSVSGGKDSTCVLELVRRADPSVAAVTAVLQWHLPETAAYLDSLDGLERVAIARSRSGGHAHWDDPDLVPEGVEWLGDARMRDSFGRPERGVFLGMRKAESKPRRLHLSTRGVLFRCGGCGRWHSNPIADWSDLDVWAFLLGQDVPYNRAYDRMEEIGVPLRDQRIGPFMVERAMPMGAAVTLKRGWPEQFNAYAARHPEVRQYA